MAGRTVHALGQDGFTGCCGKPVSTLGMGAIFTDDPDEVTCEPWASKFAEHQKQQALKQREGDQPLPVPNDYPDIQTQVIADLVKRREVGIERYGTPLQPWNGRDPVRDLYEELLDGACYAKQILVERLHLLNRIAELEAEILDLKGRQS